MRSIDKVLIPSGPSEAIDLQRVQGAIDQFGKERAYAILGVGPDIFKALKYPERGEKIPSELKLDHHVPLYNYVIGEVGKVNVELVTRSTTAVQNLVEFFKDQREGAHTIVADEWLLSKYERIFEVLRKKGKISDKANLHYFTIETDEYYWRLSKLASRLKTEWGLWKIK